MNGDINYRLYPASDAPDPICAIVFHWKGSRAPHTTVRRTQTAPYYLGDTDLYMLAVEKEGEGCSYHLFRSRPGVVTSEARRSFRAGWDGFELAVTEQELDGLTVVYQGGAHEMVIGTWT